MTKAPQTENDIPNRIKAIVKVVVGVFIIFIG
jgi:hypothetical protein